MNLFGNKKTVKTLCRYQVIDITGLVKSESNSKKYTYRDYQQMDLVVISLNYNSLEPESYDFKAALIKAFDLFNVYHKASTKTPIVPLTKERVFAIRKSHNLPSKKIQFFTLQKNDRKEMKISRFRSPLDAINKKKKEIANKLNALFLSSVSKQEK